MSVIGSLLANCMTACTNRVVYKLAWQLLQIIDSTDAAEARTITWTSQPACNDRRLGTRQEETTNALEQEEPTSCEDGSELVTSWQDKKKDDLPSIVWLAKSLDSGLNYEENFTASLGSIWSSSWHLPFLDRFLLCLHARKWATIILTESEQQTSFIERLNFKKKRILRPIKIKIFKTIFLQN